MATELEVRVDGRESESDKWETTCWGCKLQLTLPRFEPIFKCGYCGAVTVHKAASKQRVRWSARCSSMLDHVLVTFVFVLVMFIVCGGIWAVFPVLFPSRSFGFFLHSAITAFFVFNTIFNFVFAAFVPAGPPPSIEWGQVEKVNRGGLENYKFCSPCQKPKHPAAHHCRTCKACVMEMDHHCPFIGNCVGANNHGYFILFLMYTLVSCLYVLGMAICAYNYSRISRTTVQYDPPEPEMSGIGLGHLGHVFGSLFSNNQTAITIQHIGLVYLFIITLALLIGISLLLYQQLALVYEGQTYLDSLSPVNDDTSKKGWANLQRVLGKRNGRSGSFRWTKFKQTAWKLTAVTFLVAILIWRNEHLLMQPMLRT